ncbi:MAG: uroporphyrinogen decarboxylase [Pseudomonadota bacterium]|nr:uroporphyrinogen decarboxylase [Pseudomonadota bacterium]
MTILCKLNDGDKIWRPPIWLMRQAGRYLPEYNVVRNKAGSFLDLCYKPDYASEVTLQPISRFDLDAAIIFADILLIIQNFGMDIKFKEKIGPVLEKPLTENPVLNIITEVEKSKLVKVGEAINLTRNKLPREKSLIGFCGAPWTVMTYMINGRSKKDLSQSVKWMENNPSLANDIIDVLVDLSAAYLILQIKAGADVVKIFDSWAGVLNESQFNNWVIKPTSKIIAKVKDVFPKTPIIGFPKGANQFYEKYALETGLNIIAVDSELDRDYVRKVLQKKVIVQGNISPNALLKGGEELKNDIELNIKMFRDQPFILGLGHGILKETPPQHVEDLVQFVRSFN